MQVLNLAQSKEEILKIFEKSLEDLKFGPGKNFTWSCKAEDLLNPDGIEVPVVYMTSDVYTKIHFLVHALKNKETGWYMMVDKAIDDDGEVIPATYIINDVVMYPQKVTSATVEQINEIEFFKDISNEDRKRMRGQGHSHVNFSVSPSGVDTTYYREHSELYMDGILIYMIFNQKNEYEILLYDIEKNIIFEKDDIIFDILTSDMDIVSEWVEDETQKIEVEKPAEKKTALTYTGTYKNSPTYNANKDAFTDTMGDTKYYEDFQYTPSHYASPYTTKYKTTESGATMYEVSQWKDEEEDWEERWTNASANSIGFSTKSTYLTEDEVQKEVSSITIEDVKNKKYYDDEPVKDVDIVSENPDDVQGFLARQWNSVMQEQKGESKNG